jgi:hypothetical protein
MNPEHGCDDQWLHVAVGAGPASLALARATGSEAARCRR